MYCLFSWQQKKFDQIFSLNRKHGINYEYFVGVILLESLTLVINSVFYDKAISCCSIFPQPNTILTSCYKKFAQITYTFNKYIVNIIIQYRIINLPFCIPILS